MSIEKRIVKLEKQTGAGKQEGKLWVIVEGEPVPPGIAEGDLVIRVVDEETKDLIAHIKDRTGKLVEGKPQ